MKILWSLLLLLQVAPIHGGPDSSLERLRRTHEEALTERIEWEILWESPARSRAEQVQLGLVMGRSLLTYCSYNFGKCVQYRVRGGTLGDRTKGVTCRQSDGVCYQSTNQDAAIRFAGLGSRISSGQLDAQVFSGQPTSPAVLAWTATIHLRSLDQIEARYRTLRPNRIGSLVSWIRGTFDAAVYRHITVPCFASSDPVVYLYGERRTGRPIIISVFWDEERRDWVEAGLLERAEDGARIESLRLKIEGLHCTAVGP